MKLGQRLHIYLFSYLCSPPKCLLHISIMMQTWYVQFVVSFAMRGPARDENTDAMSWRNRFETSFSYVIVTYLPFLFLFPFA